MTVGDSAKTRRGENYYALKLEGVRSRLLSQSSQCVVSRQPFG